MQGKRLLMTAINGLLLGITTPALAIMSVPYGWYIEANLGSTSLSNTNYPGSLSTSGLGGNANIGYKFMPYLGMEIGYSRYQNSTIKQNSTKAATVKNYSYDIAGRGILPIAASGFELFAKLGVQRLNAHVSVNNTAAANSLGISNTSRSTVGLYFGGGAQYYFMPELAVNVQWQRAQGNNQTGNVDLFTGGLSFIFD